ncbi:hypothetical protein B0T21DRAFT_297990 [Apiosordaria backusii]|uniref:Rhodopsin domain-containing protein n=1 Tax=Apiosordaria backusii TaxID=314023 RepID=A0AA40A6Z1_9PEZI|nr:hypothetical protein B0T21DRAFT_297990 [Apiosordaria backusii]
MLQTSDRTVEFIVTLPSMTAVAFIGLFLRFFCKIKHQKPVMVDDYLMAAAWILTFASLCLLLESVTKYGYTLHRSQRMHYPSGVASLISIAQGLTVGSGAIAKASIALTLWRIAPLPWHKFVLKLITAITILSTIVTAVVISIKIHDGDMETECISNSTVWRFGVFVAGKFTLSLGCVTGILGIMKLSYMNCVSVLLVDIAYTSIDIVIYHFVEPTVIITAACVPALRFFLKETARNRRSARASELLDFGPGAANAQGNPPRLMPGGGRRFSIPRLDSVSSLVSLPAMMQGGRSSESGPLAPVRPAPLPGVRGGTRPAAAVTTVTTISGRPPTAAAAAAGGGSAGGGGSSSLAAVARPGEGQIVKSTRVVVVCSEPPRVELEEPRPWSWARRGGDLEAGILSSRGEGGKEE